VLHFPEENEHITNCTLGAGTADGGTVVKVLCYNRKVAGSIPDGVIGIFD
jgi:hypothetical protein